MKEKKKKTEQDLQQETQYQNKHNPWNCRQQSKPSQGHWPFAQIDEQFPFFGGKHILFWVLYLLREFLRTRTVGAKKKKKTVFIDTRGWTAPNFGESPFPMSNRKYFLRLFSNRIPSSRNCLFPLGKTPRNKGGQQHDFRYLKKGFFRLGPRK